MVNRCWHFLLSSISVAAFLMQAPAAQAVEPMKTEEQVFKPEVARKEVKLARIDEESIEIGYFTGNMSFEDFGNNRTQGISLTYHVNEDVFLQGNYGQTTIGKSSREIPFNESIVPNNKRDVVYYNVLIGYNLLPGEVFMGNKYTFNTDLYLVVGSGTTEFAGDDYSTFTYGWGYRFLATDWLALHLDMKNHTFTHYRFGYETRVNNLEATIGAAIFF